MIQTAFAELVGSTQFPIAITSLTASGHTELTQELSSLTPCLIGSSAETLGASEATQTFAIRCVVDQAQDASDEITTDKMGCPSI
jgi:hypothetical protein